MKKEELENYVPKGQLEGFPKEIIDKMLYYQEEQGNQRNVSVFEERISAEAIYKGFDWNRTKEGFGFWSIVSNKNFDIFFEKYPQKDNQDNSQEFKVGDKVIHFMTNKIGTVKKEKKHKIDYYIEIIVDYGNNHVCKYEIGPEIKRPFLLHYREDYNYDVIDFKNLPKRQEPKKWRAEKGGCYYFVSFQLGDWFYSASTKDNNSYYDNDNYNSGNYFRTEVEAEIIAQKLNSYFKQLIQEEHEYKKH